MTEDELSIAKLVIDIRNMDQLIFRMSQCSSWPAMRPIFLELLEGTNRRMEAESRRIEALLVPEIIATYRQDAPPAVAPPLKQNTKAKP